MNNGTKIRTALRIAFSVYTAFCVWQATIAGLAKELGIGWLTIAVTFIIVVAGLIVDGLTTYLNNDYTEEGVVGTDITRRLKEDPELVIVAEDEDEDLLEGEEDEPEDGIGDEVITPEEIKGENEVFDDGMA